MKQLKEAMMSRLIFLKQNNNINKQEEEMPYFDKLIYLNNNYYK